MIDSEIFPEVEISRLDLRFQNRYNRACHALEKNETGYAIAIGSSILEHHPGCLEARKLVRKAQWKEFFPGKNFYLSIKRFLYPYIIRWFWIASRAQRDPLRAMSCAEALLRKDPFFPFALNLLAEGARFAKMDKTAVFAWESLCLQFPAHKEYRLNFAKACFSAGYLGKAIEQGEAVLHMAPGHIEALDLVKRASVAQTLEKGRLAVKTD